MIEACVGVLYEHEEIFRGLSPGAAEILVYAVLEASLAAASEGGS
jgi:hypothetical protein